MMETPSDEPRLIIDEYAIYSIDEPQLFQLFIDELAVYSLEEYRNNPLIEALPLASNVKMNLYLDEKIHWPKLSGDIENQNPEVDNEKPLI